MREEVISVDRAVPASRKEILLWLLTGGRKGRLFTAKKIKMSKWCPAHIMCRSARTEISKEDEL